ncbi:MAG TPA: hypothetical protein VMV56_07665 [Williamwhitmania sp.]|nr:hypothetical protein [Williamwhitmania sp.]
MKKADIKIENYIHDWPKMCRDVFGIKLDSDQEDIVMSVYKNRKTTARSGHAKGKDYVAAAIGLCFLYSYYPSKVICTAPTGRQVEGIMMAETGKIWKNSKIPLGGTLLTNKIKFMNEKDGLYDSDWYLEGFKAADRSVEAWTGYHSPHMLVVITEASGIEDNTFDAIDGLLTGTVSRLLIVGNPNRASGEFYNSFRSPLYKGKFILNCLNAVNVKAKKIIIPGQVDYEWVKEKVAKWCIKIDKSEVSKKYHDFEFDGIWYRPNDLFLVKVIGEFPLEGEDQLIPLSWVEDGVQRWKDIFENLIKKYLELKDSLRLGVDIAGMGRDYSVYTHRYGNVVEKTEKFHNPEKRETIHMENAGRIKNRLTGSAQAFLDTIGEGAGVHSRLIEQKVRSVSVKFSESAKDLTDFTGERKFANMRAYLWWAIRDALDPKNGINLAIPPIDELIEDLTAPSFVTKSNGEILIEAKEKIKKRLGRSTDWGDSLANTYYPETGPAVDVGVDVDTRKDYRHEGRSKVFN